jgi:hypothetical protein
MWFMAWLDDCRARRLRIRADAASLIAQDEITAYYEAQRLAARSRAEHNRDAFMHWCKVAAEVARQSPIAEMDQTRVAAVVARELARKQQMPRKT